MTDNFSEKTNDELIQLMSKFASHGDIYPAARAEWERRKRKREDEMLSMTKELVDSTNKILTISKRALWAAIIACIISFLAILLSFLKDCP